MRRVRGKLKIVRVAWAGEKRNRKLVRVKESKEKSLKRMAGEDSQDIANNREGKRRKIVSEIEITKERVKKRQRGIKQNLRVRKIERGD